MRFRVRGLIADLRVILWQPLARLILCICALGGLRLGCRSGAFLHR